MPHLILAKIFYAQKFYSHFFIPYFFCNCNHQAPKVRTTNSLVIRVNETKKKDYPLIKEAALHIRDSIQFAYQNANPTEKEQILKSAQTLFLNLAVNDIISEWYGTPWDFNGNTQQPQKGTIACGYFVTTVLRDCGLKIQRTKLAQCPSETMIEQLVERSDIKRFSNRPITEIKDYVKSTGKGLYIVGLDNHIGFIYYDLHNIYFIHSNYVARNGVMKELAEQSSPFYYSKYKVIGKISNEILIKYWL